MEIDKKGLHVQQPEMLLLISPYGVWPMSRGKFGLWGGNRFEFCVRLRNVTCVI
jgi:hypothetical protein